LLKINLFNASNWIALGDFLLKLQLGLASFLPLPITPNAGQFSTLANSLQNMLGLKADTPQ